MHRASCGQWPKAARRGPCRAQVSRDTSLPSESSDVHLYPSGVTDVLWPSCQSHPGWVESISLITKVYKKGVGSRRAHVSWEHQCQCNLLEGQWPVLSQVQTHKCFSPASPPLGIYPAGATCIDTKRHTQETQIRDAYRSTICGSKSLEMTLTYPRGTSYIYDSACR